MKFEKRRRVVDAKIENIYLKSAKIRQLDEKSVYIGFFPCAFEIKDAVTLNSWKC